jgi:hypothetical protein
VHEAASGRIGRRRWCAQCVRIMCVCVSCTHQHTQTIIDMKKNMPNTDPMMDPAAEEEEVADGQYEGKTSYVVEVLLEHARPDGLDIAEHALLPSHQLGDRREGRRQTGDRDERCTPRIHTRRVDYDTSHTSVYPSMSKDSEARRC